MRKHHRKNFLQKPAICVHIVFTVHVKYAHCSVSMAWKWFCGNIWLKHRRVVRCKLKYAQAWIRQQLWIISFYIHLFFRLSEITHIYVTNFSLNENKKRKANRIYGFQWIFLYMMWQSWYKYKDMRSLLNRKHWKWWQDSRGKPRRIYCKEGRCTDHARPAWLCRYQEELGSD